MKPTLGAASLLAVLMSCAPAPTTGHKIVVTYAILGSLVSELVGDTFEVNVVLPNGADVHEWAPSPRDIETLQHAALIVRNGLNLEEGLAKALDQAQASGVPQFVASDHVAVRTVKPGQGLPTGDPDQEVGAQDPHLWMDPLRMKAVVLALSDELKTRFGADLSSRAADLAKRIEALDADLKTKIGRVPPEKRLLVTGHESLGYYAEAFGFTLVGAIVPSLTDQAEVSASDMAALAAAVRKTKTSVIFTELGTPPQVADAMGNELGLKVVEITTHSLPADGSYFTFLESLTDTVTGALLGQ